MKYKVRFLGNPELFIDGAPHVFPFRKAQIFALILIEEQSIARDKVCEYLWADKTIEKARRNLSNAMSYIKKQLPVTVSAGGVISLDHKIKITRDIDSLNRIDSLEWPEIIELCRPFMDMPELDDWGSFCDWLLPKRQHYHNVLVRNLKKRAQTQLAGFMEKRFEDAVLCYEKLSELEPYDEKIHGELVRLYIKTNQKVKAVDAARAFSTRIESDFGITADLSDIAPLMKRKKDSEPGAATPSILDESPLARNAEILKMLDFISKSGAAGIASCALVWGEQGIGKTVFINEVSSCLAGQGWECYTIVCSQEEKTMPLAPIMRFLKTLKVSPSQFDNLTSLSELNYSCISDIIYRNVSETADSSRKLFIIENIQWMDDASWKILESVMCDHSATRHLIISGFEEIRSAFILRTTLADEPFEQLEITLRRFNLEETERICHEMSPDVEWSNEDIHSIYMQTEGNPFFIKEIIKNRINGTTGSAVHYNNTFLSIIELLDDESRLFLEAIAVCPEYASMLELAKVLDMSPLHVSKLYNDLRLHGLLREQKAENGNVLYYFSHAKIREALLGGMSASRETALHIKNIEVMEKSLAVLRYRHKKICSRLFYHCHEAGFLEKELGWRVTELGLHFMAVHEVFPTLVDQDLMHYIPTVEEVNYTQNALSECWKIMNHLMRTEGGSPELLRTERDLYILRGGYLWWSGKYSDAEQMLRAALHKAMTLGDPEPIIKAGLQICFLAIQRDDARMLSLASRKLYRYAKKEKFKHWEGVSLRFMAIANILAGRHDEVESYLLKSTMIFEKLEESGQNYTVCLIAAEHFRGDWKLADGKIEAALGYYENCVNIGESVALFRGLGLSLAKAAFCLMLLGNYEEAEKYLLRMGKLYNIIHSDWEDGLQGGGIAFSLMGVIDARKKDWYHSGICFSVAKKLVKETKRPIWQALLYWAKLELFKIKDDMPQEFAEVIFTHPKEWYENQLGRLRSKVGWISKDMEAKKYD
ncbi:MAG: hypothetical protein RRY12_05175 [Cloacibacillus sp.]